MTNTSMRFGAFVPQGWRLDLVDTPVEQQWGAMSGLAQKLESLGYDSLWVYDHFHTVPMATQEVTYDAWTLMAAFAAVTSKIRLGQMCTCVAYRNPAMLAKVAASIDAISGGRVEMGIGAGWYEHEFDAYGYEFPKPGVRLARLREGVEIMSRLWTEDEVRFDGKHYQLKGAICRPKPLQQPSIPMWVAGGGKNVTLRIAAQWAQYTNYGGASINEFVSKSQILANHCEELGTDYDAITRSSNFNVVCEATEQDVQDRLAWIEDRYARFLPADKARESREQFAGFAGTPEQLVEKLRPWKDAGMTYAILYFAEAASSSTGIELFASQVAPALR